MKKITMYSAVSVDADGNLPLDKGGLPLISLDDPIVPALALLPALSSDYISVVSTSGVPMAKLSNQSQVDHLHSVTDFEDEEHDIMPVVALGGYLVLDGDYRLYFFPTSR